MGIEKNLVEKISDRYVTSNHSGGLICIRQNVLADLLPGWADMEVKLQLPASLLDGHATAKEYGILAGLTAYLSTHQTIPSQQFKAVEIGTFDGLGTLQIAINTPSDATIYTVDIPGGDSPRLCELDPDNRRYIGAVSTGKRFRDIAVVSQKVTQIRADSANLGGEKHLPSLSADLVFVDGCHAYAYCKNDTALAVNLLRPGGILVWHDYMHPLWHGVTRCVAEFAEERAPVFWIGGDRERLNDDERTTLAFWIKPYGTETGQ